MHRFLGPIALLELAMITGAGIFVALRHRQAARSPLHCVASGSTGEQYVFLHGLGATLRYWQAGFGDHVPKGRLLLPDLMGFGDSPKPWFRHTVERHVERLHPHLETLGEVTLVGHSLGAALALAYAARHPENVRRLVLISLPYFGGETAAYRWLRRTPHGWIVTNVALMTLACILTRRVMAHWLPAILRDLPRDIAQDVVKHSWIASTTSLWDVVYRHDLVRDAEALGGRVPVLCIHGQDDKTVPAEAVKALAEARPNWSTVIFPGVDHHPWLRRSSACQTLVFGDADRPAAGLLSAPLVPASSSSG